MARPRKTPLPETQATEANEMSHENIAQEALAANAELAEENRKLVAENEKLRSTQSEFEKRMQAIESRMARNVPAFNSQRLEIDNEMVGQAGSRKFDDEGSLSDMINEKLDEDHLKKKADELAFMNEIVTISINTTTDRFADKVIFVEVNGEKSPPMVRGEPVKVKRYFVENLLLAKQTVYQSVERVDRDGVRVIEYPHDTGLRYPFSIIHDPSGEKGVRWATQLMRSNA